MVRVNKPAHYRDVAFTYKTGGCNCEANVWESLDPTPQTVEALMKLDLASGVDVEIKI